MFRLLGSLRGGVGVGLPGFIQAGRVSGGGDPAIGILKIGFPM